MNPTGMVNPAAQLLMPLCQNIIAGMTQQPRIETKPLSIQLDEQFAAMAERYFDNLYDGRMPVPHQFEELVRRCCCENSIKHEHAETHAKMHENWGEKAPHRVFMAAVDKIIMNPSKADEIIDGHFDGATDEERRVIKQYAKSRPSTRAQAQAASMTEELYTSRLESLMTKTK